MALAAKRRRLSQADTYTSAPASLEPTTVKQARSEKVGQAEPMTKGKNSRLKKQNVKKEAVQDKTGEPLQKIWSPSGGNEYHLLIPRKHHWNCSDLTE